MAIRVERKEDFLEIVVMDDGVGMDEEQVRIMQESLDDPEIGKVDANGNVELTFVHASDYVVVLDQMPAVQTGDDTPLAAAVMMLLAGMVLLAAAARKKRIFLK